MNNLTGKNIFITGGNGLVGSHLVETVLKEKPNQVVCLVRSNDPKSYFSLNNFEKDVVLAFGDLKDKERIFDIVSKYEINHIFHLGAQPIVGTAFLNPYETLATNIMGTVNILEAARLKGNLESVVIASSDKAYGKKCSLAKETEPLAGDHPYDVSKSATDLISMTYAKTYNLPITISRFGNIFGPGDLNMNRIVPGIMKSILTGEPLELRSDGNFKRDYVYVKDVANGYLELAKQIDISRGEAFNFSTGLNLSVLNLIEKISQVLGMKIDYKILNNQKNEIPEQSLDFSKVREKLNWEAKYSFEQSIKETFDWYRRFV
jgi:CDP-glucose 4,6-dehydratase